MGLLFEEQTKPQCSTQDVNTHKAQATEDVAAISFCCAQKYISAVNRGRENRAQPGGGSGSPALDRIRTVKHDSGAVHPPAATQRGNLKKRGGGKEPLPPPSSQFTALY